MTMKKLAIQRSNPRVGVNNEAPVDPIMKYIIYVCSSGNSIYISNLSMFSGGSSDSQNPRY